MRTRLYVGVRCDRNRTRQVFSCSETPQDDGTFLFVIGPFRTRRGADFMAGEITGGASNPHCQTVADAERLARYYHEHPHA